MLIEQLLFGYRDGHRQLAGSIELDRAASSTLLGVTDTPVGSSSARLLTGLPLQAAEVYSLSATWAAPELGRPGAVWAHSLLVPFDLIASMRDPGQLLEALRRPTLETRHEYERSLSLSSAPGPSPLSSPDPRLIAAIVASVARDTGPYAVVEQDLEGAEAALVALWSAGWPALRLSFAFRTRDTVRAAADDGFVSVARRIRGLPRSELAVERETPSWAFGLAAINEDPSVDGTVRRFLHEFGQQEQPNLVSLARLTGVYDLVRREDVSCVVSLLVEHYGSSREGTRLKRALFGSKSTEWWSVPELTLLDAVVGTRKSIWDVGALDLERRLQVQIADGMARDLVALRPSSGPKPVRTALLEALRLEADADTMLAVASVDPPLAVDVVAARSDIAGNSRFWAGLPGDGALALLQQLKPAPQTLRAAIDGGQAAAAVAAAGAAAVLPILVATGDMSRLREVVGAMTKEEVEAAAVDDAQLRLALWLISGEIADFLRVLNALETLRGHPSVVWYHATVRALCVAAKSEVRPVLEVVFGPLHRAITEDRLPRECWRDLDSLLPLASDPALRLRKFLVANVRSGGWSAGSLDRALRDSGPHIRELRKELDDDDPLSGLVKAGLKELRKRSPF